MAKDKRYEPCLVDFALELEKDFLQRCDRDGIPPTPAAFVMYLIQRRVIHDRVPSVYMTFVHYPHALYEHDGVRLEALKTIADKVPVCVRRVKQILSHKNPYRSRGEMTLPEKIKKRK